MNKDFLLTGKTAKKLYKKVKSLPIIDYHNHLSVKEINENKRFLDIYDLWVKTDPYKHRAMRMCGVPEKYITGEGDTLEKFSAWCETIPELLGNPLYHWTIMELELFGIDFIPNRENAKEVYRLCNEYLKTYNVTAGSLLERFGVRLLCPCASLLDDISVCGENSAPSLRGDDIVLPTIETIKKLENITGVIINNIEDYKNAIRKRLNDFENVKLKFSDHALDNGFKFYADDGNNDKRFCAVLNGMDYDAEKLYSNLLLFLMNEYAKRGIALQLHIGAQRKTSTMLKNIAGPVGGFAAIGNSVDVVSLTELLDTAEQQENGLPKTIIFTLNPADNPIISTLSGSYAKDGVPGLITQGPAWWWCDHKKGIEDMLESAMTFSAVSNFFGMTTDSRSFLSFVRHDYFRRILCSFFAEKFDKGELGCKIDDLVLILEKICYKNAKEFIGGSENV